jgi:hypothetical protein
MTHTMRELLELRIAGKSLPPLDDQNARRVYCPICLDEGTVRIWHPKTIDEARRLLAADKPLSELAMHYDAVAACVCSKGEHWHRRDVKGGGTRVVLGRYGEASHCKLAFHTKHHEDHATLMQWLENWRPEGYTREFDSFNQTGYVNQELQF